jgi:hypothetical protein
MNLNKNRNASQKCFDIKSILCLFIKELKTWRRPSISANSLEGAESRMGLHPSN